MKELIIALTGYRRSGKDSIAEHLRSSHRFTVVSFADPIRQVMIDGLGLDASYISGEMRGHEIPPLSTTYRELAMALGHDWGRKMIQEDMWILLLNRRLRQIRNYGLNVTRRPARIVITDVRYKNEMEYCRSITSNVWHINRDGFGPFDNEKGDHSIVKEWMHKAHLNRLAESDTPLPVKDKDKVINNDRSLYDLSVKVNILMKELRSHGVK